MPCRGRGRGDTGVIVQLGGRSSRKAEIAVQVGVAPQVAAQADEALRMEDCALGVVPGLIPAAANAGFGINHAFS